MYLSYDDYVNMGGHMDELVYDRLEAKARAQLDRVTHGRIVNDDPVRQAVKYCMFDLINAAEADESAGAIAAGRDIASMSNDGVSISFASGSGTSGAQSSSARYGAIVRGWLSNEVTSCGIPLLYAGVDA